MTRKSEIKQTRWLLLALVLFSFAWRIHNLDCQSLWRDEIDAIYFALRDLPATLSMFTETAQNGALYFLALRPWLSLLGSSEFALRYLSLIFGVLSIPLLWQLCRRVVPDSRAQREDQVESGPRTSTRLYLERISGPVTRARAPLIAAALLAINPYHLWYSQEGKMYTLITFMAMLAVWFWLKGIEEGGLRPWLGFLMTVTLAIYTHLLMVLLIPLFLIWFVIAWSRSRRHWKGFLLALAGFTLPYLPLLWWQWDFLKTKETATALDFVPFGEILKTVLYYQSNSFVVPRNILYLVPIFSLVLAGLLAGYQKFPISQGKSLNWLGKRRRILLLLTWLFIPELCIYALSLRQPVFLPRYVIWITPAAVMLIALGVQSIWDNHGRLSRTLAMSLILYVVIYWSMIGWQEKTLESKTDLRSTVAFLSENRSPEDLLIIQIPNLHVAFQYYSSDQGPDPFENGQKRLGWWAAGLSPATELGDEAAKSQVDMQMRGLTFGAEDIWVMLSEGELADPSHLMLDWLGDDANLIKQIDFRGAQVRQYRRSLTNDLTLTN